MPQHAFRMYNRETCCNYTRCVMMIVKGEWMRALAYSSLADVLSLVYRLGLLLGYSICEWWCVLLIFRNIYVTWLYCHIFTICWDQWFLINLFWFIWIIKGLFSAIWPTHLFPYTTSNEKFNNFTFVAGLGDHKELLAFRLGGWRRVWWSL